MRFNVREVLCSCNVHHIFLDAGLLDYMEQNFLFGRSKFVCDSTMTNPFWQDLNTQCFIHPAAVTLLDQELKRLIKCIPQPLVDMIMEYVGFSKLRLSDIPHASLHETEFSLALIASS